MQVGSGGPFVPFPPCAVLTFCPSLCPLFSSSCLSGLTRLRPGVCSCNICIDVKPHLFLSSLLLAGGCRAQWKLHPTKLCTCAGSSLINSVYLQYIFVRRGAKPRTPTNTIGFFTRLSQPEIFIDFLFNVICMVFYSHGEGLSREPYRDYSSCFGTYLMAFLVMMAISEYLPLFE